ncbi:MAG: hypothetical protein GKR89_25180 [Candidatus Latescibacteria bacterium]|nr:hypothetical protein [Candidatus Latescibacterota bacterium]
MEHRTVIIVGGGPAGLPLGPVLGGYHPHFSESPVLRQRYPQLADYLAGVDGSLLGMDMGTLVQQGVQPVDLFRILHHPRQKYVSPDQLALDFRPAEPLDYLLITQEEVGGLWNNVPENLLTLSPGQWMEFAFYPLAQHVAEQQVDMADVNDLIIKRHLIDYYHQIPIRFEQQQHIHINERVTRIQPHERGFLLTSQNVGTDTTHQYTCTYLVYAAGQRCHYRRLDVEGEDLPFVTVNYNKAADYPGERIMLVGGGRSADWAATELFDAGKQVHYIMRQPRERHWQLIGDSRHGLPYYTRLAQILESGDARMEAVYETQIDRIAADGRVTLDNGRPIEMDHLIKEIGATTDYSLFEGFPPLQQVEKHDPYRYQLHQIQTHPHNYESVDVPNLYMGGYLASGIGLVVIAMHGTTYAIASDILHKEGRL